MDRERCRSILIEGIDKAVSMPWPMRPSPEQRAVLLSCRQVIISDDAVAEKIAQNVGPYHREGEPVAKKTMTVEEVGAIDWAALLAKLPALAALIAQIIELLASQQPKALATVKGHCPCEVHEKCHASLAALAAAVVAALDLHDCIECCDEV